MLLLAPVTSDMGIVRVYTQFWGGGFMEHVAWVSEITWFYISDGHMMTQFLPDLEFSACRNVLE